MSTPLRDEVRNDIIETLAESEHALARDVAGCREVTDPTVVETDEPGPSVEALASVATPELTIEESAELAALESIVQAGKRTFLQVAAALVAIRDKRLYRVDHSDFESYCRERWDFSRQRAHQLITAAGVADSLSTVVDVTTLNERQARALAPLTPEDCRVVYNFVKATAPDGKITAAHLQSVVKVVHEVMDTGAIDDGTGTHVPWAELSPQRKAALIQVSRRRGDVYPEPAPVR